ncbi:phage portal protein [Uliginosibacterium sp. H3]|uniref:Phage portal protein n=1 Tax=Uliginosibacterium silvisoli TaxID=3114758 RepID=A0ABU6K5V8_9RHOO|nr:phage portal protein [Uliginosibacterium sp. H3]
MLLVSSLSRWLGWPRRELPARYSDGWQAGTSLDDAKGPGPVEGFAALRRGVEILTGQLTSTPLLVYGPDGTEAPTSGAARCLRATDPAHLEAGISDCLWTGNGWLHIVRNAAGVASALEHVQAFRMSAAIEQEGVVYRCDGQPINPQDYLHLMCRNAYSAYVGDGLTESYGTSIGALMATVSIYRQLQTNGSHAEAFLSTDEKLTVDQMKQLRAAYMEQTSNRGAAGGAVILSYGLKPETLRRLPSALDADIVKTLDFSVAEASRMTGVPLMLLSVKDASAYASATESHRAFYRTTIRPLMHRVEQELSRKLGQTIKYDVGEVALGSGVERADVLSKLLYAGIINTDEARAAVGYGPVDGGAVIGKPANSLPLPAWLATQAKAQQPAPQEPQP